jgi:hypothetical protein
MFPFVMRYCIQLNFNKTVKMLITTTIESTESIRSIIFYFLTSSDIIPNTQFKTCIYSSVNQETKAHTPTQQWTEGIPNITISLPDHLQSVFIMLSAEIL